MPDFVPNIQAAVPPKVDLPQTTQENINVNPLAEAFVAAQNQAPLWMSSTNTRMGRPVLTRLQDTWRYTDPDIGYNPFDSRLEYKYADAHPFQTFGNNLVQFGARFLGAATEAIATIPLALSGESLYDNEFTTGINEWLDGLENDYPTFRTEYEENHPFLKYLSIWKPNSFFGAWGQAVNNLGYTAGSFAGTYLAMAPLTMLGNLAKLTRLFGRFGRAYVSDASAVTAESRALALRAPSSIVPAAEAEMAGLRMLPASTTARASQLGTDFILAEGEGLAAQTLPNVAKNIAAKSVNNLDESLNFLNGIAKVRDWTKYNLSLLTAATAEGSFEANNVLRTSKQDLLEKFFQENNRIPNANEAAEIDKIASEVADFTMASNVALLYFNNRILWGSLFKPGKVAQQEVIDGSFKNVSKNVLQRDAAGVYNVVKQTPETKIGKLLLNLSKPGTFMATNVGESFEEASQFIISEGSLDYARRKFDAQNRGEVADAMKSFYYGLNKTFATNEGWDNIMGGFVGGMLGGGIRNAIERSRGNITSPIQRLQQQAELMNSYNLTGLFEHKVQEAAVNNAIAKEYKQALKEGDIFKAHNLKQDMLFNYVNSAVKANRFDMRMDELEAAKNLKDEEFSKFWGVAYDQENTQKASEYLDTVIEKAKQVKRDIDKVNRLWQSNPFDYKKQAQDYHAYESYKEELARNLGMSREYQARMKSVEKDLKDLLPTIDVQRALEITSLQGMRDLLKKLQSSMMEISKQVAQSEGNDVLVEDLMNKKAKLKELFDELQPQVLDGFDSKKFVNTVEKLYKFYSGLDEINNDFVQEQKLLPEPGVIYVEATQNNKLSKDDLADALERLQDIRKLSAANFASLRYYDYLQTDVGYLQYTNSIKELIEANLKSVIADEDGEFLTPEQQENKIEEEIRFDEMPPADIEETTSNEREVLRKAAKKVVENQELTDEEEAVTSEKPVAFTHEVKIQQKVKERLASSPIQKEDSTPINVTPKSKEFGNIDPKNIFGLFSADKQDIKFRTNLYNAIFNSQGTVFSKLTANYKEVKVEPDASKFTKIPDTKLYRQTFAENVTIYHDGKEIGILRPADGVFLDELGNRSIYDIKPEEYEELTGNPADTYDSFIKYIRAYQKAYNRMVADLKAANQDFDINRINRYFNLSINIGSRVQHGLKEAKDDVLFANLNYKPKGTALLSFVETISIDPKTGKQTVTKADEPVIVNEYELTEEYLTKLKEFIKNNSDFLKKNVNRYAVILPINNQYILQGVVNARNAETTQQDRNEFFESVKKAATGVYDEEGIYEAIDKLNSDYFIANANRNVKQTFISPLFTLEGDFALSINNPSLKVYKTIIIDKDTVKQYKTYDDFIKKVIDVLNSEASRDVQFKSLNVSITTDSLKKQLPTDQTVESIDELGNKLKLSTNADVFVNYTINFKPVAEEDAISNPDDYTQYSKNQLFQKAIDAKGEIKTPELSIGFTTDNIENALKEVAAQINGTSYERTEEVYGKTITSIAKYLYPNETYDNPTTDYSKQKIEQVKNYYQTIRAAIIDNFNNSLTEEEKRIKELIRQNPAIANSFKSIREQANVTNKEINSYSAKNGELVQKLNIYNKIEKQKIESIKKATVKPIYASSIIGVKIIMEELFNLPTEQAEAVAQIYDMNAEAWAKRTGSNKLGYYKKLGFNIELENNIDEETILQQSIVNAIFRKENSQKIGEFVADDRVARERFDIEKLKETGALIGEGSDRDVYDLGDNFVLKVAKTARGLIQNSVENDPRLYNSGIIPRVYEVGANYIIAEKVQPADIYEYDVQEINGKWFVVGTSQVSYLVDPDDQKFIEATSQQDAIRIKNELKDKNSPAKLIAELKEIARNSSDNKIKIKRQKEVLAKYGLDGEIIFSYDFLSGDFQAINNWGVTTDGKPIHLDGGTFDRLMVELTPQRKLAEEQFKEIRKKTNEFARAYKDSDSVSPRFTSEYPLYQSGYYSGIKEITNYLKLEYKQVGINFGGWVSPNKQTTGINLAKRVGEVIKEKGLQDTVSAYWDKTHNIIVFKEKQQPQLLFQTNLNSISQKDIDRFKKIGITDLYTIKAITDLGLSNTSFDKNSIENYIKSEIQKLIKTISNYVITEKSPALTNFIKGELNVLIERGDLNITNIEQYIKDNNLEETYLKELKKNQLETLKVWRDYIVNSDYDYSFKYVSLKNILNYNYDNGKIIKRTPSTIRNFITFDAAAYAEMYDKKEKFPLFISNYVQLMQKNSYEIAETASKVKDENNGEWIKFEGGKDISEEELNKNATALQGFVQNTTWCTKTLAKSQLKGGDFYVYYLKNGNNILPKIAIRMEGNELAEVRGNTNNQKVEKQFKSVAAKFIENESLTTKGAVKKNKDIKKVKEVAQAYNNEAYGLNDPVYGNEGQEDAVQAMYVYNKIKEKVEKEGIYPGFVDDYASLYKYIPKDEFTGSGVDYEYITLLNDLKIEIVKALKENKIKGYSKDDIVVSFTKTDEYGNHFNLNKNVHTENYYKTIYDAGYEDITEEKLKKAIYVIGDISLVDNYILDGTILFDLDNLKNIEKIIGYTNAEIFDEDTGLDDIYEEDEENEEDILNQGPKGAFNTLNRVIYALTNPDVSTPLHELAHSWEKYLTEEERNTILKWAEKEEWDRETSEKWARGFELYLAEGNAPNDSLKTLFDKFAEWLQKIYDNLLEAFGDVQLNDEMRSVYNRMLNLESIKAAEQAPIEKAEVTEFKNNNKELLSIIEQDIPVGIDAAYLRSDLNTAIKDGRFEKAVELGIVDLQKAADIINYFGLNLQKFEDSFNTAEQNVISSITENQNVIEEQAPVEETPSVVISSNNIDLRQRDEFNYDAYYNNQYLMSINEYQGVWYDENDEPIGLDREEAINTIVDKYNSGQIKAEEVVEQDIYEPVEPVVEEDKYVTYTELGKVKFARIVEEGDIVTALEFNGEIFDRPTAKLKPATKEQFNEALKQAELTIEDAKFKEGDKVISDGKTYTIVKPVKVKLSKLVGGKTIKNNIGERVQVSAPEEVITDTEVIAYDTEEGVRIFEEAITRKAPVGKTGVVENKKKEDINRISVMQRVFMHMQRMFPNIDMRIDYFDFKAPSRIKNGIVEINLNYAAESNTEIVIHEVLHPFIEALKMSNKKLYSNLIKDLEKNYKDIIDEAQKMIEQNPDLYDQDNLLDEALIIQLSRSISKAFTTGREDFFAVEGVLKNNPLLTKKDITYIDNEDGSKTVIDARTNTPIGVAKSNADIKKIVVDYNKSTNYVGWRKREFGLLRQFINWLRDLFLYISGQRSVKTIDEFINLANNDAKNKEKEIKGLTETFEDLKKFKNGKYLAIMPRYIKGLYNKYQKEGFESLVKEFNILDIDKFSKLIDNVVDYVEGNTTGKFTFIKRNNVEHGVEFEYVKEDGTVTDENDYDKLNVYVDPELLQESLATPSLLIQYANRLTDNELVEEFVNIVNDNIYKKNVGGTTIGVKDIMPNMTLQNLSDFITINLEEGGFKVNYTQDELSVIDRLEAYAALIDEEAVEIRKRIVRKLSALKDVAGRRLSSDALQLQYNVIKRLDLDEKDIDFVLKYIEQGTMAINQAWRKYNEIADDLRNKETLNKYKINRLSKELEVVKQMVSFYDDVSNLYNKYDDMFSEEDLSRFRKATVAIDRMRHSMTETAAELATEWLYPYVEKTNELLAKQGYKDSKYIVSREDFKNNLKYGVNKDVGYITFQLGALVNSRDPINASFANTVTDALHLNHVYITDKVQDLKEAYVKWLKDNNLSHNDEKAQIDFYEKNYLRKAKVWTIIDYDNLNDKPIYGYVEKTAFHQEYLYDLIDDEIRVFKDKLAVPKNSEEWDAQLKQIEEFRKSIKEKYRNKEYEKLQKDEYFVFIEKLYKEQNDKYGSDALKYGLIPQLYRPLSLKNVAEKYNRYIKETKAADIADDIKTGIEDKLSNLNESTTSINFDDTIYRTLNKNLANFKDEDKLEKNLLVSMTDFVIDASRYSSLKEIQFNAENLRMLIEGNAKFNVKPRKIGSEDFIGQIRDERTLKLAKKKLKELDELKAKGGTYDEAFYEKLKAKIEKGVKPRTVWDRFLPKVKSAETNRLNQQLSEFMNSVFYGEDEYRADIKVGGKVVNVNKIADNVGLYTSITSMAFNRVAGVSNILQGNSNLWLEAIGGKYFTKKDVAWATAHYHANIVNYMADIKNPIYSKDTQLALIYDAIQGEFEDEFGVKVSGNIMRRMLRPGSLFLLTKLGEHQIQMQGMLALMKATNVKTKKGETINLYDAYVKDNNGRYKLREDIEFTEDDQMFFKRRLHGINRMLNGNYNELHKGHLQRTWYGKQLLRFRKWLYEGFRARWSGERTDFEKGTIEQGYLNYFFVDYIFKNARNREINLIKKYKELTPDQKYRVRKASAEIALYVMLTALALSLAGDDDKELSQAGKAMLLFTLRLRGDFGTYHLEAPAEAARIFDNPSASVNIMKKVLDFVIQLKNPNELYDRDYGMNEKGDSKLEAKFKKIIPIWNKSQIDWDGYLKYYDLIQKGVE